MEIVTRTLVNTPGGTLFMKKDGHAGEVWVTSRTIATICRYPGGVIEWWRSKASARGLVKSDTVELLSAITNATSCYGLSLLVSSGDDQAVCCVLAKHVAREYDLSKGTPLQQGRNESDPVHRV